MRNCMCYKGYTGCFDYYDDEGIFYGQVIGIEDTVTFQGESITELKKALKDSMDEYFRFCEQLGKSPDKPYSGKFTIRVSPELHKQVDLLAKISGKSLNEWIREQLKDQVSKAS